jgi:hypothetical protein
VPKGWHIYTVYKKLKEFSGFLQGTSIGTSLHKAGHGGRGGGALSLAKMGDECS